MPGPGGLRGRPRVLEDTRPRGEGDTRGLETEGGTCARVRTRSTRPHDPENDHLGPGPHLEGSSLLGTAGLSGVKAGQSWGQPPRPPPCSQHPHLPAHSPSCSSYHRRPKPPNPDFQTGPSAGAGSCSGQGRGLSQEPHAACRVAPALPYPTPAFLKPREKEGGVRTAAFHLGALQWAQRPQKQSTSGKKKSLYLNQPTQRLGSPWWVAPSPVPSATARREGLCQAGRLPPLCGEPVQLPQGGHHRPLPIN